ncbi:MAG: hypothetical protein ACK55I_14920, partial [bacterium]
MSTPPQYSRKDEASLLSSDQSSTASSAEVDSPGIGEDSSSNGSSDLPASPAVPPLVSNKATAESVASTASLTTDGYAFLSTSPNTFLMSTPPQYSRKDEASLLSSDQSSTA